MSSCCLFESFRRSLRSTFGCVSRVSGVSRSRELSRLARRRESPRVARRHCATGCVVSSVRCRWLVPLDYIFEGEEHCNIAHSHRHTHTPTHGVTHGASTQTTLAAGHTRHTDSVGLSYRSRSPSDSLRRRVTRVQSRYQRVQPGSGDGHGLWGLNDESR